MNGSIESNECSGCGKITIVNRTYYYYPVKCTCCNNLDDDHFEIVYTCKDCVPKAPRTIKANVESTNSR